jgi:L-serine deaminase
MRAGKIFVADLVEAEVLQKVDRIRVGIYGSLALTGEGHMTPSAILLGLEGANVETVDTAHVPARFSEIKSTKKLFLGQGIAPNSSQGKEIDFDYTRDFIWEWGRKLPLHSNGMRFTVFDKDGDVLATNDMFSVGGGFVVNGALSVAPAASGSEIIDSNHPADLAENMYYKSIRRSKIKGDRKTGPEIKQVASGYAAPTALLGDESRDDAAGGLTATRQSSDSVEAASNESKSPLPKYQYAFRDAASLLALCKKHNLTIAQLVYENEKSHGYTDEQIYSKLSTIWQVMDASILEAVQAPPDGVLPGSLKLKRRAPALYQRLTRGMYPSVGKEQVVTGSQARSSPMEKSHVASTTTSNALTTQAENQIRGVGLRRRTPARTHGSLDHPILPSPTRRTTFQTMDYLTVYAIAVNETNAAGGRIVTAPTNGAAGIIPAVLKYIIEFISDDPDRDIPQFLLTAAAIGMLYKRGATISAAEGGCMAEVGVACSMAAGAFAACMGASPETIEQAAEIGIEHNLGLTCDPIGGLVQAPCIERNALGAIKAISSANLALSSDTGTQKVRLDDAIHAMRLTAKGMRNEFKETSLSGLATSVALNIPVSVPSC